MFAAVFTSGGEGRGVSVYFAPLVTLVPVLFGLLSMKEFQAFGVGTGLGVLVVFAVVALTLKGLTGDAMLNVLDSFLQLFVTPPSTGSFFTRDVFGLRRSRGRRGSHHQAQKHAERFDKVAEALQGMETRVYESRETLGALTVQELKQRLGSTRGSLSSKRRKGLLVEKTDLIDEILAKSGTSNQVCAICFSDYESGDVQRKLPCGHLFHIECVDQWILKQANTDHSKPPACPMCARPVI